MKLTMRVKEFSKKTTLMSTAFVLAVSTLSAAIPFIAAEQASALTINGNVAVIENAADLAEAAANDSVATFSIKKSFTTENLTVIDRKVYIDGNGNTITLVGAGGVATHTNGWGGSTTTGKGEYVFQAYKTTLSIKNLKIAGGDAAIYANGSTLNLQGTVDVSGNEFGGIELSRGSGVIGTPTLNAVGANVVNATEVNAKPTVWVDKASDATKGAGSVVNGSFVKTTHIGADQHQYYLRAENAAIVATNVTTGATYGDVQVAINSADVNQVIQLQKDIEIGDRAILVNKQITLDGNNKTITAPTFRGLDGDNKNAAIVVTADNAIVENVSIASTYTGSEVRGAKHGIVVQRFDGPTQHVNNVKLNNITVTGASAGLILNNSTVTVDGISTIGGSWYGIGIDKGAQVTVKGVNSHAEPVAIKNESNNKSSFTDEDGQYVRIRDLSGGVVDQYTLASKVPIATVTVDGKGDGAFVSDREVAQVEVFAAGVAAIKSHWVEVKAPNGSLYYLSTMSGAGFSETFDLRNAKSGVNNIPLDNNGRLVAGEYTIRYVAKDMNSVRNDDLVAAKIKVTVDNTNPTVSAALSSNLIVLNNALPTITINASDANGIDYVQYKIVRADDKEATVVGWVTIDNQIPTTLEVAGLSDGDYIIVARAFDNAGNKKSGAEVAFTIDRTISTTVSVSNLQSTTPTLNGTALRANNTPVANEQLTVTVDSIPRTVTTSTTGAWELPLTGVAAGKHNVTVAHASAGTIVVTSFTTTLATVDNGDTTTEEEEEVSTTAGATNSTARFPFAFAQPSVLGDADTNIPESDSNNGAAETKGASDILAQAVDADNTNGEALGLAWYWWLLIAAGVAAFVWWIAALIRRRNAEA